VALWCDLRVAADNAIFGVLNRRWSVPLVDGEAGLFTPALLPARVGVSAVRNTEA
jgi:hypothetical protein